MTLPEPDLDRLLDSIPAPVAALARKLVRSLLQMQPDLSPKVQFGWRSVNFRHPEAGFVCAVFPYEDRVSLVFEHGRQLSDASGLLQGEGTQVRFIPFQPGDAIPFDEIALLLAEAVALRA